MDSMEKEIKKAGWLGKKKKAESPFPVLPSLSASLVPDGKLSL